MANLFQRLFDTDLEARYATKLEEATALVDTTTQQNHALHYETERLQESMTDLALRIEDLNWDRIDGYEEDDGFPLKFIKDEAEKLRPLLTINPTIKKAVNTRVGYIWGRGVSFEGDSVKKLTENPHNSRVLFDPTAYWKLEAQLATDGNVWAARNRLTDEVLMIPMAQIKGWVLDENDPTRVTYWYREYTIHSKNFQTGAPKIKEVKVFYPAYGHTGTTTATIDGIKVDRNFEVVHIAANRQESWILGVPDLMSAMFWAKAHKELFEAGTTYVKAQGKFASKVVAKTGLGAQNAAARIADSPRRDPLSGEVSDIGGTAAMSGGLDYQLMGKMSGGVDFEAFDPVAGLVAVGLGVPLDVLLGRSDAEEKSLEQSVVDEMNMRRDLWSFFFRALFGKRKVKVIWPKIKTEPEYRRIQAIGISAETHVLHRHELRQLTLEGYGIQGDPNDLPDMEEHPNVIKAKITAENAAELAPDDEGALPEQGVTGKVGKLSTGKDAKDARDNGADKNVKKD